MALLLMSLIPAASSPPWTVQQDVDFPHRAPDAPGVARGTAYFHAPNASACAAKCLTLKDCAAIAWNGGTSDHTCNFKCDDVRTSRAISP